MLLTVPLQAGTTLANVRYRWIAAGVIGGQLFAGITQPDADFPVFRFDVTPPTGAEELIAYDSTDLGNWNVGGYAIVSIKAKTDLITTGTAISIVASVSIVGGTITARAGDSWLIAINGLGDISDAAKLWFSINGLGNDDADAKLFIEKTDGLTIVNGEVYTTPGDGQLTVDDATLGNVLVNVQESVTKGISLVDKPWTIKMLTNAGDTRTLVTGDFRILKYGVSAIT